MEVDPSPLLASDSEEPIVINPPPKRSLKRYGSHQRMFNSKLTVEQLNAKKLSLYYQDLFHTLVNMRGYRFLLLFLGSYISMYCFYATFYMSQPTHCVSNVDKFTHALWFSVHTAATIGYGYQAPDPDCFLLNLAIMAQVLTVALMQAALLGLVYARFSAPSSRATTIKFSSILACYRGSDGYRRLAFRVANLRKHQVLQPEVHMLLMRKESIDDYTTPSSTQPSSAQPPMSSSSSLPDKNENDINRFFRTNQQQQPDNNNTNVNTTDNDNAQHTIDMRHAPPTLQPSLMEYRYHELKLNHVSGHGTLWLGVPSIMAHTIDSSSPLWGISRTALEESEAEFIVLLDGIDESTSTVMQARHSYFPSDIVWDESFTGVLRRRPSGVLAADYNDFDLTRPMGSGNIDDMIQDEERKNIVIDSTQKSGSGNGSKHHRVTFQQ